MFSDRLVQRCKPTMRLLSAGLCCIFIALTTSRTVHDSEVARRSLHALEFPEISIAEAVKEIQSFSQSDVNDLSQLEERDVHSEDLTTHHVSREKRSAMFNYTVTTDDAPNLCDKVRIDSITMTKDESTYIFKGAFYWKMGSDNGIASGYPKMISENWDGLPDDIDASFSWPDGETFFFKGKWYWRFLNMQANPVYPKRISQVFVGVPDYLDAAVVLHNDANKVHFFRGEDYWLYDSITGMVLDGYPKKITIYWRGLPNYLGAAVRWKNNRSYFFKDGGYYRVIDSSYRVDPELHYPQSIATEWFGC